MVSIASRLEQITGGSVSSNNAPTSHPRYNNGPSFLRGSHSGSLQEVPTGTSAGDAQKGNWSAVDTSLSHLNTPPPPTEQTRGSSVYVPQVPLTVGRAVARHWWCVTPAQSFQSNIEECAYGRIGARTRVTYPRRSRGVDISTFFC